MYLNSRNGSEVGTRCLPMYVFFLVFVGADDININVSEREGAAEGGI
jgi:hypothetical protein